MIMTLLATSTSIAVHVMERRSPCRTASGLVTTMLTNIVVHVMEGRSPSHRKSGYIPVTLLAIPITAVHAMGGSLDHKESGRVMRLAAKTVHAGMVIGEGLGVVEY
jgi:hypothetical protein